MSSSTCFECYEPDLGPEPIADKPILEATRISWRNGLVVRSPNWLGDVLMVMPAVRRMKTFLPQHCGLFVLCRRSLAPLWEAAEWVDQVICMDGSRVSGASARQLKEAGAGVAVVMPNSWGAAFDVFAKGIPLRLGRRGRGRRLLLTHALPEWPRPTGKAHVHQLRHYLQLASAFGRVPWRVDNARLELPGWQEIASDLGMGSEPPWLVLAPGAAYGPAKQWPIEHFRAVAEWWSGQGGAVAVVGTAADRPNAAVILEGMSAALNLAGKTDLKQLMAVLKAARFVVANDSGAMHLGAGLGCQGVAVFGSTDAVATGPIGGRWVVLSGQEACSPCFQRRCPKNDAICEGLEAIRPQTVCEAVEWLERNKG